MVGTPSPEDISPRLQRIGELAREAPEMAFTTLAHHIDLDLLHEAYRRTRKDGALGIDGQSAQQYAENLEGNLRDLLDRFKSGRYRAPGVRRVHIPKGKGSETRPLGIPTFEDKILQRAVLMVLEAVYESDFRDSSYGFRPRRSAHQALERLWMGAMAMGGGWVLDVDIQGFFEAVDPKHLRAFLDQRVRDGVLRRLIHKWLKAGVFEEGRWFRPATGTPQGGVISPLLANIYLHYVLDVWFEDEVVPRLRGPGFLIRYADDCVIVLGREDDAERVMAVLPKRLARFGLRLHPEKTRVVRFRRPRQAEPVPRRDSDRPETFDFLGFTHYWKKSRRGRWILGRKTARNRYTRAVRRVRDWLRRHRHRSIDAQHRMLSWVIRGHCAYYGITGNSRQLGSFRYRVTDLWRKWLDRRSQHGNMTWKRFMRVLERYPLPPGRVVHSVYRRASIPA